MSPLFFTIIVTRVIITTVTINREGSPMKFYARKDELAKLEAHWEQTQYASSMTILTGRRRIGKTSLARTFIKDKKSLYLFISKKKEQLLCTECVEIIQETISVPVIGEITSFSKIFKLLMEIALKQRIVVVIDEFQEFFSINESVYSEIQNIWDEYKERSRVHMIFIGSVYSLMHKIFQDEKEPLFGRADRIMALKPFPPSTLKQVLLDNNAYSRENLFSVFTLTGGIPRYVEILTNHKAFTREKILDLYVQEDSPFLHEGKTILIEEFGKEYATYFSILSLLSEGRTSRSEIESILEKNIGGYLERLQKDYNLVQPRKPVGAKPTGKVQKYFIKDNFLSFWFRFIYKNYSAIEIGNFEYIRALITRDWQTYSGPILERLLQAILAETKEYNLIGNYWERGNLNEIDIVAINEMRKKLFIAEVKSNPEKASMKKLKEKAVDLIAQFPGFETEFTILSLIDIDSYI